MVQLLRLLAILPFFILLSTAFAQNIQLEFRGYGKTYQEIHLTVKNVGEQVLSDATFYVDGNAYETISGTILPGSSFVEVLNLKPGKHLIEVRTPEGAYAKLEVEAKEGAPIVEKPQEGRKPPEETAKPYGFSSLALIPVLVIIALVVWLLVKRS